MIGTLNNQPKLRNLRRDPRITLSFDSPDRTPYGLNEYLVIRGRARLTEGGAADLLQRLARIYLGPDVVFPGIADPPPGFVVRIAPNGSRASVPGSRDSRPRRRASRRPQPRRIRSNPMYGPPRSELVATRGGR